MIIATAVPGAHALAQETTPPQENTGLSEIVVTAEKRPSTEQKTAIAMSVMTAEALAKNGVNNLTDLAQLAPSVEIASSGPSTIVTVRGVSSRDTRKSAIRPSRSASMALRFNAPSASINRCSILNASKSCAAPQGTLLGRNATGSAISLVTAKPQPGVFKAYAGAEAGTYGTFNTKGMINVPVNDWLTARASFQTQDHNGYRNNAPSENGDDEHSRSGRLHLLAKPTDRLSILVTGEYSENHGVGPVIQAKA
jgi:iron complex outermembrane receptor protein